MLILIVAGICSALFLKVVISIYNALVSLKNQIDRAWANIDVILKQRFDEIPQLVQIIEQFAGYEMDVINKLTQARSKYVGAQTTSEKIKANSELGSAFQGFFALGESYPELKSNASFLQLQGRVSELESTLADRRETYNECVTNFNTRLEQFPDVIVAKTLNYNARDLFQIEAHHRQAPSLKMNLPKSG